MTATDKHAPDLRSYTDEELVASAQILVSSSEAFAELMRRHRSDLLWRCRVRLGNFADAEDALQETLIRAYRGLALFRGVSSFRTWLFAIADNQCNTVHARRMRHIVSDHVRSLITLHEERVSNDSREETEGLIELVHRVLNELPSQARDVLLLRFHSELSLEDIANTLGIGLSASKMRLYRAVSAFEVALTAKHTTDLLS